MMITYFVRGVLTNLIRIGTSSSVTNVFVRFGELQKLNCDKLELLAFGEACEASDFDRSFSFCFEKSHGQWLVPSAELLAYVNLIKERPVVAEKKKDYSVKDKIHERFGYTPVVPPIKNKIKSVENNLLRPFKEVAFSGADEVEEFKRA